MAGHDARAGRDPRAELEALQAVFAALAHPARRRILMTVHFRGGSMTAGEIAGRFAHAWPTTTRHLRVLENAGLLRHRRRGRTRIYAIQRARLDMVEWWLDWFDAGPAEGNHFILVDDALREAAGLAVGRPVRVAVEPRGPGSRAKPRKPPRMPKRPGGRGPRR